MSADQPRGPNRAWKNQPAGAGAAKAGKRAWQKTPDAPTGPKRPWSKKSKLGLATFAVSVIIALMIVVIRFLIPAKPACLVLIGAGFEEELSVPHNVYGWQGLEDLSRLVDRGGVESWLPWSGTRSLRLQYGPREYDDKQGWVPKDFKEDTVVVFLALHGGSDRASGAYLVKNGSRGPERVSVKEIIKSFDIPELKKKKKVLILDATQVAAHWPSGMLHNDFVLKLKELKKDIEDIDNLVVLCASDENQRSWVSEEWRQTIFTHYVIEGLKGAADNRDNGGDGNSRVTALELYNYVGKRVEAWVQLNRGDAVQRPILLGGTSRADQIDLVQIPEPYQDQAFDSKVEVSDLPDLKVVWEEWKKLRDAVPAPAVYTPQLWRRYQDTLLRYEQLLRAGDPTHKAGILRASLGSLKNRIASARSLEAVSASLTNTLPMPAEVGRNTPWKREELVDQFKALAAATLEDRPKTWDKLKEWAKAGEGKDEGKLLQVELTRLLLEQVVHGNVASRQDLNKTVQLLSLVETLSAPRPVEAHYLVMLLRDLDAKAPPLAADLRLALQVCLLAEKTAAGMARPPSKDLDEVHPYSEVILPWIKDAVVKADEPRRLGQDLLFGPAGEWDKARRAFTAARAAYQKAGKDAETVRQALELRDQVLAWLPYYAQWLAMQRGGADAVPVNELLKRVEDLARGLDDLTGPLAGEVGAKGLDTLKTATPDVSAQFQDLRSNFEDSCRQLKQQQEDQVRYLAGFEAALAVPLIEDPRLRLDLLDKSRKLSARFNKQFNPGSKNLKAIDDAAVAAEALENAKAQGRMAVAITGLAKRWLDTGNPVQMYNMVANLPPGPQWHDDIAAVGKDIAGRYREMRDKTAKGWKESMDAKMVDLAAAKIQVPEILCRLIPGGEAPPASLEYFDVAVDASRRLRFHNLLLWQAKRTLDDHWYKDSEAPTETYYEPAANAYVKDAADLVKAGDEDHSKERQADALAMKQKIVPAALEAKGPRSQPVTSESQFTVTWKLNARGLPPGVPVFWLEVNDKGPVKPLKAAEVARKALDPLPRELSFALQKVEAKDPNSVPEVQKAKAILRGLFRGQRIEQDTELSLYKDPEIHVYRIPPPDVAGVSLRMDEDFPYGAVSIVLDCSGSMNEDINGKVAGPRKIDLARKALKEVLQKLPRETWLSVLVFGQEKPAKGEIYVLRPPAPWYPDNKVDGLKTLMDDIGHLEAAYRSPIAEAIGRAKDEGFPPASKKYSGAKAILTLTDGTDNEFDKAAYGEDDYSEGRAAAIQKYLKRLFDGGDIEVGVICFAKKETNDARGATKQFGGITRLDPPGQFLVQEEPANLAQTLEEMLRPRLRLFTGDTPYARFPEGGLRATAFDDDLDWKKVDPAYYTGHVQNIYSQDIALDPGQLLNITMTQQGKQVSFKRGLLYDFIEAKKGAETKDRWSVKKEPWYVSVAQNRLVRPGEMLQQLVAIESTQQVLAKRRSDVPLRQQKPGFVWMELKTQAKSQTQRFLWHDEFGYPAPTFLLQAPRWSPTAAPELQVWWSQSAVPEENQKILHPLGQPLTDLQKTLSVADNRITLTTVKADPDRLVTVAFEGANKQAHKPCLVVEIEYEPGKPVWLIPDERLRHRGEEHLFYTSSGKYTAVFYGVSNPEALEFTLTVVSLESFKKTADATNRHALFRLNPPEPGDMGPSRKSLQSLD